MPKLKINLEDLEMAFDSTDPLGEAEWYLDLRTGEVVLISHDWADEDDVPEWQKPEVERYKDIEENPSAYLYILAPDASDDFEAMSDFVDGMKEGAAKDNLREALRKSKPFREFRNTLANHAAVQAAWFTYKEKWLRQFVKQWLDENEVDAELVRKNTAAL